MSGLGADVAGIDAAARLLDIAVERNPHSEIVHGSMFDLPWAPQTFDAVVSINGIWGGGEDALREAHRVLRPGGTIGISFRGKDEPLDLRPFFFAVAAHLDRDHVDGMVSINNIARPTTLHNQQHCTTNNIARPGVAEDMLTAAGFEVVERDRRTSVLEWPDEDIAWRALRSVGPIVPALRNSDPAAVRRDALAAIDHCRTARNGSRTCRTSSSPAGREPERSLSAGSKRPRR